MSRRVEVVRKPSERRGYIKVGFLKTKAKSRFSHSARRAVFGVDLVQKIRRGGVGVIPTDTLYGIVGSAFSQKAVARIYRLRKRNLKKPMIVLIGDMRRATWDKFGIHLDRRTLNLLKTLWPGKVSIILPIRNARFLKRLAYLHRGTKSIAFRMPKHIALRRFLVKTGPLVAPSANIEGQPPACTIRDAQKYFGGPASGRIDFYVDSGRRDSLPSTLIAIRGKKVVVLRKGAH